MSCTTPKKRWDTWLIWFFCVALILFLGVRNHWPLDTRIGVAFLAVTGVCRIISHRRNRLLVKQRSVSN